MSRAADQPWTPVAPLFEGPIDVVGDVHGEWLALRSLLDHLGYDRRGEHRQGRRLVFMGDLCDRGPDSVEVVRFVAELVRDGLAQCLLGNHELNVVRNERKPGNGWFFDAHPDHARPEYRNVRRASERERDAARIFFSRLPIALQRADLRLTHAAWHEAALAALVDAPGERSLLDRYAACERASLAAVPDELSREANRERRALGAAIYDPLAPAPALEALSIEDEQYQMGNPLRVLTSGIERRAERSFFAGGRWRRVRRVPWWNDYAGHTPVIVGHYWRWLTPEGRQRYFRGQSDLFEGAPADAWLGSARRVYCIDFSVGARYREIHDGFEPGTFTRLGAVRWPENELVLETGERRPLSAASAAPR